MFQDGPAEELVEAVERFPAISFENRWISSRLGCRSYYAAFGLPASTIAAVLREEWPPEIGLIWADLMTDDHQAPRETSIEGFVQLARRGPRAGRPYEHASRCRDCCPTG
jgi:hypothetical protein